MEVIVVNQVVKPLIVQNQKTELFGFEFRRTCRLIFSFWKMKY